ncbi:hypothetical protein P8C59_008224 [Phyllachora maydis]|uniref:Integrase catalytic domain-containing protein n=1 Tax=Phyllachora maydis TaxID=1825666 RepID=A0AAD9IBS5_9PEZI|nr:hypothetical protein P8C59_008224 [Phyllachora maydis]
MADILEESRNPAIEVYRAAYIANSSNSTPNSNSNPSKKGKNKKKGKKKASYNVEGQNYSAKSAEQASFILGSYSLAVEEEEEESDSSSNSRYKKRKDFKGKGLKTSSNNKAKYKDNKPRRRLRDPALYNSQLRPINTGNGPVSPAGIGCIILEVLSRKAPPTYTKLVLDNVLYLPNIDINIISGRNKIVVEIPSNSIRKEDYRPIIEDAIVSEAIEPNKRYKLRNSPAKGTILEGIGPSLRGKRPCRPTREPEPLTSTGDLPCVLREPVIEGNKVEKAISSPTLKEPNIGQRDYYNLLNLAKLWHVRLGHIGLRLLKKTSSITKGLSNFDKIKEADFHCSSCDRGKAVRRVIKALIPDLPRVLDLIEGDTVKTRPRPYNRNPIVLLLVDRKSRYRWVFNLPNKSGPIVANAIKGFFRGLRNGFGRYPTKFHFDGGTEITDLLTTWLAKRGIKFSTSAPYIHEQNGLVERLCFILEAIVELVNSTAITNKETTPFQALFDELEPGIPHIPNLERYRAIGAKGEAIIPLEKRSKSLKFTSRTEECKLLAPTDNTALEGELVDLDLDLEGAVSPDPSNLNTKKPISIEIGPSKLEPYESSSDKPIIAPKPIEVIAPNQPITNEPLDNSDLISEGDKMQLDYYKLLAKTSSYILSFVYKARKRVISKDSTPTTYKQVLKLPRDERSKWLEAITKEFIYALREEIYIEIPEGLLDLAASNKAIYKLLLKYSYNPSTPNIIKLSKALYSLKQSPREWQDKLKILLKSLGYLPLISDPGVFYNAKTCHFIVTYIDDCLFIGPNIGYITDLKKRLNKVYAIEDLGPAAYFLGGGRIGPIVTCPSPDCTDPSDPNPANLNPANLNPTAPSPLGAVNKAPKRLGYSFLTYLTTAAATTTTTTSSAANPTTTTTATRSSDISFDSPFKGLSSIADLGPKLRNSSNITTKLSRDFHSKEGPRPLTTISTTIVDSRNSKGSSRTSIINSSLVPIGFSDSDFAGDKATSKSTYGYLYKLAEAIREVQWIIGLFSELYRPIDHPITLYGDNQGSITVANDPALHARTKHTLLKFRYVREQVKAKIVTIIYLHTKCFWAFNLRELFTKLPFTPIYILYTIYIEGLA